MKLKEIAINTVYKHPLSIINKYAWCVQEQYWSYLKDYDTGKFQKAIIRVDDDNQLIGNDGKQDEAYSDVAIIDKYFDITMFLTLKKDEKKKILLELLHDGMLSLARCYNWDVESLINAYNECINSNIEYRFKLKNKNYISPTKEFVGYVECYWDIDSFTATGVILRKSFQIVKKETLINVEPYQGEFIYYSKCKWEDDYTFSLYSKEGNKWSIAILSLV